MVWNPGQYKMPTEAVVLAGGFGTRLKSVVKEVPKPMAPIENVPFLEYLLCHLHQQGIKRVVLSVGYLHEQIEDHFGSHFKGMEIDYALETSPLGTGGGVLNALQFIQDESLFLLNGDTFFDVDLKELSKLRQEKNAAISFSLKPMRNFDRYGSVELTNNQITAFHEKRFLREGLINGGVYCMRKDIFKDVGLTGKFSLEQDYFEAFCGEKLFAALAFDSYFIDIGIPEDYRKAEKELAQRIHLK